MALKLEDVTYLEKVVLGMSHEEALTEFWGDTAFSSEIEEDEEYSHTIIYAVYNDDIDDYHQLGTLTEIFDIENEELLAIKIYREVM